MTLKPPKRGFDLVEFGSRTAAVQEKMHEHNLDALLLTTEPHVRYFSGFFTQFWQSPTRPWFLIIPLQGKPIAVIPGIGEVGMRSTWIEDVRLWSSPRPDDDGISLLSSTINGLPKRFGKIGATLGAESYLKMPANDFQQLKDNLSGTSFVDFSAILHRLICVKSSAEIEKIKFVCELTSDSFIELPNFATLGNSEREIVQAMRIDLLQRGADNTPYIISGSGPNGYDSIIMGPTDRVLNVGDVLIIDTGTTFDGYFSDFDRNYAFGNASDTTKRAYETVYKATDAGFATAKPGVSTTDIWRSMWDVLQKGGAEGNNVGRMGHGLGMQLTEWPSITAKDNTVLEAGMVITLEPGMSYDNGKQMVHEENILITDDGAVMLSKRASPELVII